MVVHIVCISFLMVARQDTCSGGLYAQDMSGADQGQMIIRSA